MNSADQLSGLLFSYLPAAFSAGDFPAVAGDSGIIAKSITLNLSLQFFVLSILSLYIDLNPGLFPRDTP